MKSEWVIAILVWASALWYLTEPYNYDIAKQHIVVKYEQLIASSVTDTKLKMYADMQLAKARLDLFYLQMEKRAYYSYD